MNILSVSQLNNFIKDKLDNERSLQNVFVQGQISNYKLYPSGHRYFSIKDSECAVKCVMFKRESYSLEFEPKDGDSVIVEGRVSVYPRDGIYQIYCTSITNDGIGLLQIEFEKLKKKLSAEGLFETAHKKKLPVYPHKVALITSPAGAAVRDMIKILKARWPLTDILVVPVSVQGAFAPGEIASAISYVNCHSLADLIITGRGGGSIEDLWAFNEEAVARAIYSSDIPVISAVGHEPDVTISDYVADKRASTPSNAAEIAVPDINELSYSLEKLKEYLFNAEISVINTLKHRLKIIASYPSFSAPLSKINSMQQYVDSVRERINSYLKLNYNSKRDKVYRLAREINALSPLNTLLRGYSIVTDCSGTVVAAADVSVNDEVSVLMQDGKLFCTVNNIELRKDNSYGKEKQQF